MAGTWPWGVDYSITHKQLLNLGQRGPQRLAVDEVGEAAPALRQVKAAGVINRLL
jgi:hypothetical protein